MTDGTLQDAMLGLLRKVSTEAILPHYQTLSAAQIESKAPDDLVTVADRLAEKMLTEGLARIIPGLPVVGEEAAHANPEVLTWLNGDCWIVDPIDGTHNFAHGKPPFGILIAMASGGEAHAAWIYDVLTGRLCTARRGRGAYVGEDKLVAKSTGKNKPVVAISTLFMNPQQRETMKSHIAPNYTLVDIPRCAAEQYPRLALGINDVSIFERTLAWDHAAGALWLNEAGGKCARLDGSPYRVDEPERVGLIGAASPALWHDLAARIGAAA